MNAGELTQQGSHHELLNTPVHMLTHGHYKRPKIKHGPHCPSGVHMSESPAKSTRKMTDWQLARRIMQYMRPAKKWLTIVALTMPLGVLIELAQPILLKKAIDEGINKGDPDVLMQSAILYACVVLGAFVARTTANYGLTISSLRALATLRDDVYTHVMNQGQAFFDTRTTGSLMTRTTNDVEAVYESLAWGAARLISDGLTIIGTIIMMLALDWRLTLVSFALSPIIVIVVNLFRRRLSTL